MGLSWALAKADAAREETRRHCGALRDRVLAPVLERIPGSRLNGLGWGRGSRGPGRGFWRGLGSGRSGSYLGDVIVCITDERNNGPHLDQRSL